MRGAALNHWSASNDLRINALEHRADHLCELKDLQTPRE